MRPKYFKFRELILFKVLWRWKYKKGDVVGLWCYCPKCQSMLMVDDENCRSEETLQHKITYFVCQECGGNELGRVIGGDRRYILSLVRRDIWRHIRDGSYNEVASATKGALELYAQFEETNIQSAEAPVISEETPSSEISDANESTQASSHKAEEQKETSLHVNAPEVMETTSEQIEEPDRAQASIQTEEIKKDGI